MENGASKKKNKTWWALAIAILILIVIIFAVTNVGGPIEEAEEPEEEVVEEETVFEEPDPEPEPAVETFLITLEMHPDVGGSAVISEEGLIEANTQVTVTAEADQGFVFVSWKDADLNWSDDISTDADYTFTVNSDRHLIAYFEPAPPLGDPPTFTINIWSPNDNVS